MLVSRIEGARCHPNRREPAGNRDEIGRSHLGCTVGLIAVKGERVDGARGRARAARSHGDRAEGAPSQAGRVPARGRTGYDSLDYVLAGPNGEPLLPRSITRQFKRLAEQAGLPDQTVHGLRHSFATVALGSGVASKVVQEMLGHASISTTLDLYSHTLPGMDEAVAETVAAAVFGPAVTGHRRVGRTFGRTSRRGPRRETADRTFPQVSLGVGGTRGPESRPTIGGSLRVRGREA